ncbi:peptidoglycan-binding protein [Jiella avicenniae]|uniref:Peptidoglycan-binding protein n=1 Tax=Jiella avicenniae TaxID=2907202 RepID=A0A9X1T634_9HYPH|nr:peptidoglycan-binding protein [Jiella avicenniae]MCE7030191.1 peptidoglycan-binding protein [Jiella avicenniae]
MTFEAWLQSRLTAHGFACGPIDGVVGPITTAAIRAFEASRGLPVDGMADDAVVTALRESSSQVDPETAAALEGRAPAEAEIQKIDLASLKINAWPRQSGVPAFYGAVGTRQTRVDVPFDFFLSSAKTTRVKTITLHEKVAASASRVLQTIAATYSAAERKALGLDLFGGSLAVRRMRGGSSWSMHSWGIAIDFDPERNQLKWGAPKARLSHDDALPFWRAWEAEGWLSLGRARNYDFMHVQAARL